MTKAEIHEMLVHLRKVRSDLSHIEVKASETELPKRLWESVSAFANTRAGGTIILGVAEKANFAVTGVRHADQIQRDFANLCSSMEPAIRPHIEIHDIDGKHVITAQIPELPVALKPCYHPHSGLTNGAFVRVADGDRKLSPYEVQMLLSARGQPKHDEEPIPRTGPGDLHPRLLRGLLNRLRARSGTPFEKLSDERVLRTIKVLLPLGNKYVCSLGGLLALGKYPQQTFPGLALTFVAYPSSDVGEPGASQERFLDNARIEGPIPSMLDPILAVLRRNMKQRSTVRGLYREDMDEYPLTAVREALINAVAHRDLSSAARGTPVQVQMFPNRLTIINPGGLFGPVTLDQLGQEGISSTRNTHLLRLLEDINPVDEKRAICENRGSGVGAMFAALRQAGLPEPHFEDRISSFRVTILNSSTRRTDAENLPPRRDRREEILALLASGGELSRGEISDALGLGEAGTRKWLTTLREEGKVEITTQQMRSKNARYRIAKNRRRQSSRSGKSKGNAY